jgi:sulfur carrier protein
MKLIINGELRDVTEGSLTQLLESLKIHPKIVVVELNGEILQSRKFNCTQLKDGDKLEIVQMMAGG